MVPLYTQPGLSVVSALLCETPQPLLTLVCTQEDRLWGPRRPKNELGREATKLSKQPIVPDQIGLACTLQRRGSIRPVGAVGPESGNKFGKPNPGDLGYSVSIPQRGTRCSCRLVLNRGPAVIRWPWGRGGGVERWLKKAFPRPYSALAFEACRWRNIMPLAAASTSLIGSCTSGLPRPAPT